MKITLTQKDIKLELARRDIKHFISYVYRNYIFEKFNIEIMTALNQFLDDLERGVRPILIIQAPPQHGKSELASRNFPAYAFGRNPNYRIAGCSYNSDLANSMNRDVQRIMLSDEYKEIFPNSSLNKRRIVTIDNQPLRNSERFDLVDAKGYYVSAGVGGSLTGKAVDIGIIDDPTKNMQEARSESIKKTLIDWYQTVFLTRLSKNSGQLIMATRWAVDDLIGYIIDNNKANDGRLKILKFSALNENGEALHPKFHPLEQLEEIKKNMDSSSWSALYQQEPVIRGGNLIKGSWFKRYATPPERYRQMYIVCDTAFSEKKSADNSAFGLFGITENNDIYLLDMYCKKVIFPDLARDLKAFYLKAVDNYGRFNNINAIYIENKGSGQSLIQQLREERLPVLELQPTYYNTQLKKEQVADKYTRFLEISADLECGYCWLPESSGWVLDFLNECEAFTGAKDDTKDDRVDVLIYGMKKRRENAIIDWDQVKKIFARQADRFYGFK